eukprot:1150797-Pyramimonas_sp.AAC.1
MDRVNPPVRELRPHPGSCPATPCPPPGYPDRPEPEPVAPIGLLGAGCTWVILEDVACRHALDIAPRCTIPAS